MLPVLRHFVRARDEAIELGFTDNGGAIHSVKRILDILSTRICYPQVSHYNSLKKHPNAHRSTAANNARNSGERVEIEHVLPQTAYTQIICAMVADGASDDELIAYIRENFRLVLLTPGERKSLDQINRSKVSKTRLADAGITMHHFD